jgi:hypothetical protein
MARTKEPTGGRGLVLGVVAVPSVVLALPPRSAHHQPRPPRRLTPQPRRPQSQRTDLAGGGKAGRRRRQELPRRETVPAGLQVEGPHVHGCEGDGGRWIGLRGRVEAE